jgi:hypothetical protein
MNKKKRNLLGLLGLGAVAYIVFRKKPAVTIQQTFTEGAGAGTFGGLVMAPSAPTPTPTPTPAPTPTPTPNPNPTDTSKTTTDPCGGMGKYNATTQKCDNDSRCGGAAYDPVLKKCVTSSSGTGSGTGSGSGTGGSGASTGDIKAYDPCTANGYGGTYDAINNKCIKSAYCGGNDAILDSNGKAINCSSGPPSAGGGGVVSFTGKIPLTLDNLLM